MADEGQLRGNVNCCNWLAVAMVIAGRSAGAATGEGGLLPGSSLDPHSRSAVALEKIPFSLELVPGSGGALPVARHGYSMNIP